MDVIEELKTKNLLTVHEVVSASGGLITLPVIKALFGKAHENGILEARFSYVDKRKGLLIDKPLFFRWMEGFIIRASLELENESWYEKRKKLKKKKNNN